MDSLTVVTYECRYSGTDRRRQASAKLRALEAWLDSWGRVTHAASSTPALSVLEALHHCRPACRCLERRLLSQRIPLLPDLNLAGPTPAEQQR